MHPAQALHPQTQARLAIRRGAVVRLGQIERMAPRLHPPHRLPTTGAALQNLPQKRAKRHERSIDSLPLAFLGEAPLWDEAGDQSG